MRALPKVLGVLVFALVLAEVAIRVLGYGRLLTSEDVSAEGGGGSLRSNLDGWFQATHLQTDAAGQRLPQQAGDSNVEDAQYRLWIIGGGFTAALGLEAEDAYPARLRQLAEQWGAGESMAIHVSTTAPGAAAKRECLRQSFDRIRPHCVVLQVEPADVGYVAKDLVLPGDLALQLSSLSPSRLHAWNAVNLWRQRKQRADLELAAENQLARDGFGQGARSALFALMQRLSNVQRFEQVAAEDRHYLGAILRVLYDPAQNRRLSAAREDFGAVIEEFRRQGAVFVLMVTGPRLPTTTLRDLCHFLDIPVVVTPPYQLDGALRVGGADLRPAAIVHELTAQSLLAGLLDHNLAPKGTRLPEAESRRVQEILDFYALSRGQYTSIEKLAGGLVPAATDFQAEIELVRSEAADPRDWDGRGSIHFILEKPITSRVLMVEAELLKGTSFPSLRAEFSGVDPVASSLEAGSEHQPTTKRYRFDWPEGKVRTDPRIGVLLTAGDPAGARLRLIRAWWL